MEEHAAAEGWGRDERVAPRLAQLTPTDISDPGDSDGPSQSEVELLVVALPTKIRILVVSAAARALAPTEW